MTARALARHGLAAVYRAGRRCGLFRAGANELTVLTFHRITTPGEFHGGLRGLVNADPGGFDRMLRYELQCNLLRAGGARR